VDIIWLFSFIKTFDNTLEHICLKPCQLYLDRLDFPCLSVPWKFKENISKWT